MTIPALCVDLVLQSDVFMDHGDLLGQRLDFAPQFFVARAGRREKSRTILRRARQRRMTEIFDLLRAFRRHSA